MLNNEEWKEKRRLFEEHSHIDGGLNAAVELFDAIIFVEIDLALRQETVSTICLGAQIGTYLNAAFAELKKANDFDSIASFTDMAEYHWNNFIFRSLQYMRQGFEEDREGSAFEMLKRGALRKDMNARALRCYASGCRKKLTTMAGLCSDHNMDDAYIEAALSGREMLGEPRDDEEFFSLQFNIRHC